MLHTNENRNLCRYIAVLYVVFQYMFFRDIKPQNVMYDVDDTPVLMDFGSMGSAQIEIKNLSDALKIQVIIFTLFVVLDLFSEYIYFK